ncbi:HNH endonuclease [Protaetiibacter larvae]|uniref:HNH endonuclease n=1 Tax=Protaetiibacter larvae TaxID=2592654 RepID=UPI00143D1A85|nr:HNH endonuclease signature motif containing protein [Protaetiibacter larvae]
MIQRGPGLLADPAASPEKWGGRKAQQWVAKTLAEYGTTCHLCGLPGANSADHVIPIAEGGAVYNLLNLGPAHRRCNYARGKRSIPIRTAVIETGLAYFTVP